jgi:hypothetical protein
MKAEKTFLFVFPPQQSVDTLTTRMAVGVSTLFLLLTGYRQQSVDNPHGCRRVNTSTLLFGGNSKNNFFHVHKALTEAL